MPKYKIAETETFEKKINTLKYKFLYKKIKEYIYPILRENPYFGPNIKKLKGEYVKVGLNFPVLVGLDFPVSSHYSKPTAPTRRRSFMR